MDFTLIFLLVTVWIFWKLFFSEPTKQHDGSQHSTKRLQRKRPIISDMEYNLDEPLIRVWLPDENNTYGHVSLQTNKYYMSFWPQGQGSGVKGMIEKLGGAPACIIFHPDFDCSEEGNRFPNHKLPVTIAKCSDMDRLYERFLAYNGIDKEEVSLKKGCEIRNREDLMNRRIEKNLGKTKYKFLPKMQYKTKEPFYYNGQSCVSFVYHMIEWSKFSDSKKITIKFFGNLFKFLDMVTASFPVVIPKREVYVQVWMHTVDGRVVQGTERMLENQLTGELENLTHTSYVRNRQTIETEPLTFSYNVSAHVEQNHSTNIGIGTIWKVPNFFSSLSSMNQTNEEQVYQFA